MKRAARPVPGLARLLPLLLLLAIPAAADPLDAPLLPREADAPAVPVERSFIDHVVVVLDASGSMDARMADGTRRMDAAKNALAAVLGTLPPTTHVGVLVFSAGNLSDEWVHPLGPRRGDSLERAVRLPEPGGGTPLGAYIKQGADRLLEARAKGYGYGTYRLLVVTDGEAHDSTLVDRHVPDIMSRGITIDAIGVDMKENHTLARKVHSYRRADDPASFARALAEVFAEVGGRDGDGTGAVDFSLLAPLPAEVAAAALSALASSGNHPVGTRPGDAYTAAGDGAEDPGAGGEGPGGVILLFVLFVVAVNLFEKAKRALKGKG